MSTKILEVNRPAGADIPNNGLQPPTPERFINTVGAHQQTEAIKAAIDLEIFTAIAEGCTTAAAIAKRCQAAERGVRILCDFLTIHRYLTKEGAHYGLAPDSALFLNRHSPAYLGCVVDFLLAPNLCLAFTRMSDAVRRGGSALGHGALIPENPDWIKFAHAMMPLMHKPSEILAAELLKGGEARKVLDIAAGHGIFGISVAKQNPAAHIYACDWRNVLDVALGNATAMGVADRYHLLPGNAFETDFGGGYDLVLIPNFLHHFDPPTCTSFLRKVYAALRPGGRAAIAEFVPNSDRVSPPMAAAFSLVMLVLTPNGDAYTFEDLEAFSKQAGFVRAELAAAPIGINRLVIAYR
jgi:ubiquinone/menaquinone biosynthesis C-methylase UbiE